MSEIDTAVRLAAMYHADQYDKRSRPYILHVIEVMMRGESTDERIVGVLHDILEDTKCTVDELHRCGIRGHNINAIIAITRVDGETYRDYIRRVSTNELATRVKIYDLTLNLATLDRMTRTDTSSLSERYTWAYYELVRSISSPPMMFEEDRQP